MIGLTRIAERQLDALRQHFIDLERVEAARNLAAALDEAILMIGRNPEGGLVAPRPYPALAKPGRAWVKAGRYWVMYRPTKPLVITGIYYDAANIPNRLRG